MNTQELVDEMIADVFKGTFVNNLNGEKIEALRTCKDTDAQNLMLAIATRAASDKKNAQEILETAKGCGFSFTPRLRQTTIGSDSSELVLVRTEQAKEYTALHKAVAHKCSNDVISFLLEQGYDINLPSNWIGNTETEALNLDINIEHLVFDEIRRCFKTDCGITPLSIAIFQKNTITAKFLLEQGASPNPTLHQGAQFSPIFMASLNGTLEMIDLLMDHGVEIFPSVYQPFDPKANLNPIIVILSTPEIFFEPTKTIAKLLSVKCIYQSGLFAALEIALEKEHELTALLEESAAEKRQRKKHEYKMAHPGIEPPWTAQIPTPLTPRNQDLFAIYAVVKNRVNEYILTFNEIIADSALNNTKQNEIALLIIEYASSF